MVTSSPRSRFSWMLSSLLVGSSSLLAATQDTVSSRPILEASWSIRIAGSEQSATEDQSLALNDAGPVLVNHEVSPVAEGTPPAVAQSVAETASAPLAGESPRTDVQVSPTIIPAMTYVEAYNAVPFSRAEYEANPSYRHEAAMELMFRQLRPTTILKQYTPRAFRYPDFYQYPYSRYPYSRIDVRQSVGAWGIPYPLYAR